MKKVIAVAALVLLAGCSAQYDNVKKGFSGHTPDEKIDSSANTVRYDSKSVYIEAASMSREQVDYYYANLGKGACKNPFTPSMIVFLLTVRNKGKSDVTYNPGMTVLYPSKGDTMLSLDYTSFYTDLEYLKVEDMDERLEAFKAGVFRDTVTVKPGQEVQKLVPFVRKPDFSGSAILVIEDVFTGAEKRTVPLYFNFGKNN